MKVDLIRKYKWYLFGAIAVILIMSIGLSFCAWDNGSAKSLSVSGSVANYKPYNLVVDNNENLSADVGDIVTFGRYYQSVNQTYKDELRWIVVDIRKENNVDVMYLLTEKVVASGNFYGKSYYYDGETVVNISNAILSQCYDYSTLRAWLNSEQFGEKRADGGTPFGANDNNQDKIFRGFYNEAFSDKEKKEIVGRNILPMYGYSYAKDNNKEKSIYAGLQNQKVWVPSLIEITGNVNEGDNDSDKQFSYFSDDNLDKRVGYATKFNSLVDKKMLSNYSYDDLPVSWYNLGIPLKEIIESAVLWRLRTPVGPISNYIIDSVGKNSTAMAGNCSVGVRPAICLQR